MAHVVGIHVAPGTWPEPVHAVESVEAVAGQGLVGDRKYGALRQISIVSTEELDEVASEWGGEIPVGSTRRQITVSGTKLNRERGATIRLGEVVVSVHGDCSPCEEMEEAVGPGARAALVGRAGIVGIIVEGGTICLGDEVQLS
ncbi:MAG: MOSC domain-containing protein [Acidimicrobiia bacterium]